MAVGFTPKYIGQYPLNELTPAQFLALAVQAAQKLDWNILFLSDTGFIAHTNKGLMKWNAEVTLKTEEDAAMLKSESIGSEMMDLGKNKKNITAFIAALDELRITATPESLNEGYESLKPSLAAPEEDVLRLPPPTTKQQLGSVLGFFIPRKDFYITPLLIDLNILIFIAMALNGVSIINPGSESLLAWGANFRPMTLSGQWWRLITNCFLHIGIMHLLLNMYALLYIGVLLEPYLGRARFLAAYLLTGIAASVTSLWWHELTVSAGASGAIFGMYGVFLAMLTTNLIEKTARRSLLTSIGIFVVYNLAYGAKGGIDNAAHIGGLISGAIIGYAFIPGLKKPAAGGLKYGTIGLMTVLVLAGAAFACRNIHNDIGIYEEKMKQFSALEAKALDVYNLPPGTSDDSALAAIKNRAIPYWEQSRQILSDAGKLDLPAIYRARNKKIEQYCALRIESCNLIAKSVEENTADYDEQIKAKNNEIDALIKELGNEGDQDGKK